jgi:DNA-binding SARP family transcriptional activator
MTADRAAGDPLRLCLFNGPYLLMRGEPVALADGTKRMLVFVALRDSRVDRGIVARTLWPDLAPATAGCRLRTALWRLGAAVPGVLTATQGTLGLRPDVQVDVRIRYDWAGRLVDGTATDADLRAPPGHDEFELLPGWADTWVILARERTRQRLLHGVEALSCRLLTARRIAEAVDAALLAASIDPLRESAHRALVAAHLADGNIADARKTYDEYRVRLRRELGVNPSTDFAALMFFERSSLALRR